MSAGGGGGPGPWPGSDARSALAFGALAALTLLAAIGGTVAIQVRDYLMVPAEQLTARYKGGQQWIALRSASAGRSAVEDEGLGSPFALHLGLAEPAPDLRRPRAARPGTSSPTPCSKTTPGGTTATNPGVRPRTERIVRDLEARPPSIVLAAYPAFPALRRFLDRGYIRSALPGVGVNSPGGIGLWIEKSHYAAFER